MSALRDLLLARVRREPMTFRDFMAQALYHPEHGYYTTGKPWRGRGDFATAPRYGEAFAVAVAQFLARARDAMGPGPFDAVEVGAGSGGLAAQLHALLAGTGIRLRAVEPRRPPLLPPEVPWSATLRGVEVRGALVSNELFDALPVHLVTRTPEGLRELWVVERDGALALAARAPSRPEVPLYVQRFGMEPEEGHVVEVGLDALAMVRDLAAALREGVVLTVDYGFRAREAAHQGPVGTLAALRDHRASPDPLADPGEQDLTAHVNFTALEEEGRAAGLDVVADVPQWQFLGAMGALAKAAMGLQGREGLQEALAAKALLAPGRMGDFRVLVQAKGLAPRARLALNRALEAVDTERF